MRRLLLLGSTVVFLEVVFYTAITPLLPGYADQLGLSKAGAGLLSASYAIGTLVSALPAGYVAARFGPRRALVSGLLLLGASSAVFGFVHPIAALDTARFAQGIAGSLAWAGALTWLIVATERSRRGSTIGNVLGTAIAGSLLGPVIGALAQQIGTEVVFSSVLVVTTALALAAMRLPPPPRGEQQPLSEVGRAIASASVLRATLYVAAPSAMFGVIEVLVPLRIDQLGGGAALIAAGFTVGAGFEAVLAPLVGRLSDRVGRLRPYRLGMLICAASIALFPAAQVLGVVMAALIGSSLGAGLCFAPAMAMLSDAADASALHQGFSAGLTNMAWATGQVLGEAGGGAWAASSGNALPCLFAAALLLATVAGTLRSGVATAR